MSERLELYLIHIEAKLDKLLHSDRSAERLLEEYLRRIEATKSGHIQIDQPVDMLAVASWLVEEAEKLTKGET